MAWGRFDDLEAGTGLLCPSARRVLVAQRPEDVVATLNAVEAAVAGGDWAFGFVSYEAAPGLDPDLAAAVPSPHDPPLVWFGLCDPPVPVPPIDRRHGSHSPAPSWRPGWSADQHRQAVECVQQHIAAGQTYQCNLADRLYAEHAGDPLDLYADLVVAQRGAYNAYLDLGRHVIASASPELFVSWSDDLLQTRPMKGTTARGRTTGEDQQQAAALRSSAKERAENLMIVDLLRNDLSRIAQTGTVQVAELFALERYPTLWQLTSQITARPSPGLGLVDVFRALFPCGSVTGAPKARTMQLIRDLEAGPRGVYCGAVGLLAPPGQPVRGRFSVAIRTVVADQATCHAVYGTGSAITCDSPTPRPSTPNSCSRPPSSPSHATTTSCWKHWPGPRHRDYATSTCTWVASPTRRPTSPSTSTPPT